MKFIILSFLLMSAILFGENSLIIRGQAPITYTNGNIAMPAATGSVDGYLSAANFNIFNSKQNAITIGNLTDTGTDGITVTGGTGSIIGSGTSLSQHVADTSHNGYLLSTDWTTFNNKQASGNYITALTGDVTASGPGSAAATVAKIQGTTVSGTSGTGNVIFSISPTFSGQVLIGAGTVGAPGLAITGSATTGIYSSAADEIDFSNAGTKSGGITSSNTGTWTIGASGSTAAHIINGSTIHFQATNNDVHMDIESLTSGSPALYWNQATRDWIMGVLGSGHMTLNRGNLLNSGSVWDIDTAGNSIFSGNIANSVLTVSQAVFTDSSKNLVSNAITGTGSVVMSASPTLTGTITAATGNFSGSVTMATGSNVTHAGGDAFFGLNSTTSGNPQIYFNGNARDWTMAVNGSTGLFSISRGNSVGTGDFSISLGSLVTVTSGLAVPFLTASLPVFTDASSHLTTNTVTGTGSSVLSASPTLTGTVGLPAATISGSLKSGNYHLEPLWGTPVTCTTTGTLDFSTASTIELDLTASDACTLTVSNIVAGAAYVIKVLNATSATMVWPTSFDWGTAGAPTLSASGKYDDVHLLVQSSTTHVHAYVSQGFSN